MASQLHDKEKDISQNNNEKKCKKFQNKALKVYKVKSKRTRKLIKQYGSLMCFLIAFLGLISFVDALHSFGMFYLFLGLYFTYKININKHEHWKYVNDFKKNLFCQKLLSNSALIFLAVGFVQNKFTKKYLNLYHKTINIFDRNWLYVLIFIRLNNEFVSNIKCEF